MFGMPSLQIIMITFVSPILISFALIKAFGMDWVTVGTWWAVAIIDILVCSGYFPFMYNSLNRDDDPQKAINLLHDDQPTRADDRLIPSTKSGGQQLVYGQNIPRLKIDCVAKFNQIILTQLDGNLDVDMTENYWVKRNNGAEQSEWVRIGGVGPTEWRDMIERGIRCGAYKRVGGQNKCVPADRAIIRSLAKGFPLPQ